jgi:hypothetical protein
MEQQEPREKFVTNLHSFCEEVQLNDGLIDGLKQHSYAKYIDEVMVTIIRTLYLNFYLNNILMLKNL